MDTPSIAVTGPLKIENPPTVKLPEFNVKLPEVIVWLPAATVSPLFRVLRTISC